MFSVDMLAFLDSKTELLFALQLFYYGIFLLMRNAFNFLYNIFADNLSLRKEYLFAL